MKFSLTGSYFYGNKASDYATQNGYLDYHTFASAFPHILNNDLINLEWAYFEPYCNEFSDDEDDEDYSYSEVFQWYIVPEWSVKEILQDAGEIVWYSSTLDIYLWGVTHYGTSWDYVLTGIKINTGKED